MNNEIDWLCHLGVSNGTYDAEQLKALWGISNEQTSLMEFAQGTLDNGFTADVEMLQTLIEQASGMAAQHGPCPQSIFGAPTPAPAPQQAPAAPERRKIAFPAASSSAQAAPAPQHAPAAPSASPRPAPAPAKTGGYQYISEATSYPFDINGFPDLSKAENCSVEETKELVKQFLTYARSISSSDVHFSAASYPHIRRFAINYLIDNQPILSVKAAENLNMAMLSEAQIAQFKERQEMDYSTDLGAGHRYRINIMQHFRGIQGSYRVITERIKSLRELGFANPEIIEKLTTYHQGLILVTGPSGAGKTTTLASLVDLINKSRKDHIITVEDPVEIIIPSAGCSVTQRELNTSTMSFPNALRAALREDPDIIIVGEMRDLTTIEMAISAAETGHLVIGTLHTSSAAATLDRLLDVFPPSQQPQIRAMLAESLKGIICQMLIPDKTGTTLLMAPEILIGTLAVGNLIKENKTFQLASVIETGSKKGMVSSEDSIINLFMQELITAEQAKPYITSLTKLKQVERVSQAGGAQAFEQQQAMAAEENTDTTKKKGWFR